VNWATPKRIGLSRR